MTKRALILATGESEDTQITPLRSPVPDGERLRDLLAREDVGGYEVRLLPNPSLVAAQRAIADFFGEAKAEDALILLITGHGMRDYQMRLYFATAESRQDSVRATSLEARFVLEERDRSIAARKILMFDTCHAGSYAKGHYNDKSAQSGFLLEDFDTATEGTAVLTASSARQSAREAKVDGVYQSHFTRLLIEGIETGAADPQGTGEITLDQLFAYLRSGLRRDSPGQTPSIEMKGALGSFVIARNPAWRKPQLSEELQEAVSSPNRVSRRGAIAELVELVSSDARESDAAKESLLLLLRDSDTTVSQAVAHACQRHGVEIAGLYSGYSGAVASAPAKPVAVNLDSAPARKVTAIASATSNSTYAAIADEPPTTASIQPPETPLVKWYQDPVILTFLILALATILFMAGLFYSEGQRKKQQQLADNIAAQKLALAEFPEAIGEWRKASGTDRDCTERSANYLKLAFKVPLFGIGSGPGRYMSVNGSSFARYDVNELNSITAGDKEFFFIKSQKRLFVSQINEAMSGEEYVRCPEVR